MSTHAEPRPEPLVGFDPGEVRSMKPGQMAVRFAFGAAVSVIAGSVSLAAGAVAGGVFLAFPAILPASLTLLEREEGTEAAWDDVQGSVLGTLGLVAFALVVHLTAHRLGSVALALAVVAWAAVAVALYVPIERYRRARNDG